VPRAVTPGDRAYARLPAHRHRIDAALTLIDETLTDRKVVVAFSGGKDSTVLLHLVRRVQPQALGLFIDSGAEYPDTYRMVEHYRVHTAHPQLDVITMCRMGGYWGYRGPLLVDPDMEFDFTRELLHAPAARFLSAVGADTLAMGLRAAESNARRALAGQRGPVYDAKYDGTTHLCPLMYWSLDDVWAYIAAHDLRYHEAYDRLAAAGVAREDQRVSTLLDAGGVSIGRFARLRQLHPQLFNVLAADFPKMRIYT
jgi:phosphoadenosine phosphosulfate reductase